MFYEFKDINKMKKIRNYIMLLALALVAVCCSEEDLVTPNNPSKNGEDVQFGLSFDNVSRTIYGAESNNAFPVYWSKNDKVLIASPQCSRQSAEYVVTPVSGQSYAKALTRTGEYGVQWGSTNAVFYSVYPSTGASWTSLGGDNVTAKLNIASQQSANLVLDGTTYSAADMDNVIMYAQTGEVENGSEVNLEYTPYSTMLEFEIAIDLNKQTNAYGTAKVVSMTLTAPTGTNITGDFTLKFNGSDVPTIVAAGNNGNTITMNFTTQPVLNKDNSLKAKMALIPFSDVKSLTGWKVSITVLEGNETATITYTKTLTPAEVNDKSDLVPGKIHKIELPKLTPKGAWEPDYNKWITQLYDYKNIYLTELSLPGAWYAGAPTEEGYQATADIATLWAAGVRAFATECRTSSSNNVFDGYGSPEKIVISGTGRRLTGTNAYTGGTAISTLIGNIATQVKNSVFTDGDGIKHGETAVLILSYADGGETGHRDQDHSYFINGIKTEIENSGADNIVTSVSEETTVSAVLGQLIIKINVDDNIPKGSYDDTANMLFSYNPFVQQLQKEEGETVVDYSKILYSKLHWKIWKDSAEETYKTTTSFNNTDFLWCFSSANRTQEDGNGNTTIPTYSQRQTALRSMITQSKNIAEGGKHNVWFYFNAGGTQTTSQTDGSTSGSNFATNMNPWLLEVIKLKANGGTDTNGYYTGTKGTKVESVPSSLGLVMFNYCTSDTYRGPAIIKEIIEMNNKFKLQRYSQSKSAYASSLETGGNAIGWE